MPITAPLFLQTHNKITKSSKSLHVVAAFIFWPWFQIGKK